jgi:DNA processing protein
MDAPTLRRLDAIEFSLIPGIGTGLQDRLWRSLSNFSDFFNLNYEELNTRGLMPEACRAVLKRQYRESAREILEWTHREGYGILLRGETLFPPLLEEIDHPPLVLYAAGQLEVLKMPSLALVGTRRPTCYGLQMAEGLAYDLAQRGIAIVSGLARGIDGAAHRGCLEAGTGTIAVLGCGIDVTYPREHRRLSRQIQDMGLLLSEFPPGTPPLRKNFPMRNRILSGLAPGCLIIEAKEYSGSLITARFALEQNREVFALPGNITSPQSFGPNFLIKKGAKAVQSWKDIVEELAPDLCQSIFAKAEVAAQSITGLSSEEITVLELLRVDEVQQFDKILLGSGLPTSKLNELLFGLEMKDLVRQIPGNLFVRVVRPTKSN